MSQPLSVACFGAAHIDIKAQAKAKVVMGSSNPAHVLRSPGGVARNVAESLGRLAVPTAFAGRVGDDAEGHSLASGLAALGVDTTWLVRQPGAATGSYTAFLDLAGGLVLAMVDSGLTDALVPENLTPAAAALNDRPIWFVDANLPEPVLAALAACAPEGTLLAADAVSVAKAPRLTAILPRLNLLFANRDEVSVLALAIGSRADAGPETAARSLAAAGAQAVVVGVGNQGVLLCDRGACQVVPPLPAKVREVTGAGDGLIAGTLFGLAWGEPMVAAVGHGLAAAAIALESAGAVDAGLTPTALRTRAAATKLSA